MAESNIEIWTRLIDAFNERGIDGALEFFAPDAEVYDPDLPAEASSRGPEAIRRTIEQLMSGFAVMRVEDFEFIPAGDRVVGLIDAYGRGTGTRGEMELNLRTAHTMTFREGKVVYWRLYRDQEEALADAGLSAAPGTQRPGGDGPASGRTS
jgi:ketosteroid isomerase-like protein